nr:unnamed protein product [Callosobruchus chinensis]
MHRAIAWSTAEPGTASQGGFDHVCLRSPKIR